MRFRSSPASETRRPLSAWSKAVEMSLSAFSSPVPACCSVNSLTRVNHEAISPVSSVDAPVHFANDRPEVGDQVDESFFGQLPGGLADRRGAGANLFADRTVEQPGAGLKLAGEQFLPPVIVGSGSVGWSGQSNFINRVSPGGAGSPLYPQSPGWVRTCPDAASRGASAPGVAAARHPRPRSGSRRNPEG